MSHVGVRIAGTGSCLPRGSLTNADLEKMMDTTDEWIVQRTGIRRRYKSDFAQGETVSGLGARALAQALHAAGLAATDLDLIIGATMTPEMECPTAACLMADTLGATNAGAFDLNAACSGFVFGLNVAHGLIRGGAHKVVGLVGGDTLTKLMDYSTQGRGTSIIFGDAAGAAVLVADPDPAKGVLAQAIHAKGCGWRDIYVPHRPGAYPAGDFPEGVEPKPHSLGHVQMNGSGVFKFAVSTFPRLIEETLEKANLDAADIDMFVCHQSNARILHAARERFGVPEDKLYINIERVGNTVGASVPLCLDELTRAGRVRPGMKVLFLAFGGGLTWGSSLWQM